MYLDDKDLCPENIKIPYNKNRDRKLNFWNGQKRDIIPKNLISKSCKLETALISINRGMDKQVVTYSDARILLGHEKEQPAGDLCDSADTGQYIL